MPTNEIGARAKELDEKEIIYRIRIGRKTAARICLAVLIWIMVIIFMTRVF